MSSSQKPRLAMLIFAISTSAHADWQYTHWGMSQDQAVTSSNGSLAVVSDKIAAGTYLANGREFHAILFFGAGGLKSVELTQPTVGECAGTLQVMQDKYGPGDKLPSTSAQDPGTIWRDEASGNIVDFRDRSHNAFAMNAASPRFACSIEYRSLKEADSGL
jgi:hypothetical protein